MTPTSTVGEEATATVTPTGALPAPTQTPTGGTATPTVAPACLMPCAGDCNGNCEVTIDELITMVNVALETFPVTRCVAGDANNDQTITINELILAVNRSLNGCLFAPTGAGQ